MKWHLDFDCEETEMTNTEMVTNKRNKDSHGGKALDKLKEGRDIFWLE